MASEFDRQFAGHEDAVRGALPIKKKRAQAFMRLAKNKALVRQSNWNQLPYDFEAVLALTLVPPDVIERAIADQRINFSMSVADANRLRRQAEWGTAP